MRFEKIVLRVGGTSMLFGTIAFGASLVSGATLLRTLAIWFLAIGVVVAFLPLAALVMYTAWEKLRGRRGD